MPSFLRGTGQGPITAHPLSPGVHMVTARDPDDMSSPRVARNLPCFRQAVTPRPPDWSTWPDMLADSTPPSEAAINIAPFSGFGTVSSALLALGSDTIFLTTAVSPDKAPFVPVEWPK